MNGKPFGDIKTALDGYKVGDQVTLSVIRDAQTLFIPVTLLKNQQKKYKITTVSNPDAQQIAVRTKWLKQ